MAVGDGVASGSSASSSINAEKRICRPAVPLREATLPAGVLISYFGGATTRAGCAETNANAPPAETSVHAVTMRTSEKRRVRLNQDGLFMVPRLRPRWALKAVGMRKFCTYRTDFVGEI